MQVRKEFFQYVIPSMLAFALSGIYAIADGFFVGNALGDNALAAVNMAFPMTAFIQAIGTGIGLGGAILFAIRLGNQQHKQSHQYFGMSVLMLICSGLILTFLVFFSAPIMLQLFGATGVIYDLGKEYLFYISIGALFQVLGTGLVPFIRNMGHSMIAMIAMILGFLTNILLDYLFVWVFPWGMMGAALATVIGQAMTLLVCTLFFIYKKMKPTLNFEQKGISLGKEIFQVALSPFGLTFSPNITLILINKSAVVFGGALAVTCYAPISYIGCVILLLLQGISDGCQPLLSLTYGKGEHAKTATIRKLAFQFALLIAVVCMVVLWSTKGVAAQLFGASQEVIVLVAEILPIFLLGYVFISISRVTTAYFYATNKNLQAYLLIYGEPCILCILLLCIPNLIGLQGTWYSVPISQILIAFASIFLLIKDAFTAKQ